MKYEYKVVRSFAHVCGEADLQSAFNQGYEFVRASEPIKFSGDCSNDYIEYILRKEVKE